MIGLCFTYSPLDSLLVRQFITCLPEGQIQTYHLVRTIHSDTLSALPGSSWGRRGSDGVTIQSHLSPISNTLGRRASMSQETGEDFLLNVDIFVRRIALLSW